MTNRRRCGCRGGCGRVVMASPEAGGTGADVPLGSAARAASGQLGAAGGANGDPVTAQLVQSVEQGAHRPLERANGLRSNEIVPNGSQCTPMTWTWVVPEGAAQGLERAELRVVDGQTVHR